MGIGDVLLGGLGKSTNPADYQQQYANQPQIMGAITPGMATQRTAPQANMSDPFRAGQLNQIGQLQGIASGQQKGAGELAAQRQTANAVAQQQAMARLRGRGGATATRRAAQDNIAGLGITGAGMAQRGAMQDQQFAHSALTGALGQGRGQDQAVELANLDAKLRQMGMDDQSRQFYLNQLTQMNANQLNAGVAAMTAATQQPGILGSLISAGAQIGGAAAMPGK